MGKNEDRSLWLQWVQDLPGPWPNSCEARWQGLQIFGRPYHEGPSPQEKPPKSNVDCTLQTQAQEGYRRGGKSSKEQLLELHSKTLWLKGIRNPKCARLNV